VAYDQKDLKKHSLISIYYGNSPGNGWWEGHQNEDGL
jgi:hypothetical protein